jgi:hypothetical protein
MRGADNKNVRVFVPSSDVNARTQHGGLLEVELSLLVS